MLAAMFPARDPSNELEARDLLRLGVVASVDQALCVVDFGDGLVTAPIPWTAARAGRIRIWTPLAVGEQVLVFAPEGDLARAVAGPSLFQTSTPPPATDDSLVVDFDDGTRLAYAPTDHRLTIILAAGGSAELVAPGGVSITGDVAITGDVEITGGLRASVDVVADTVSLTDHVHTAVQPAAPTSLSGKPKP